MVLYFAYGSNMSVARLKQRVPSARSLGAADLKGHRLAFHKRGRLDRSGKCDAAHTGRPEDCVCGVLYSIAAAELAALDRIEGRGAGYERHTVSVVSTSGERYEAETYIATEVDSSLRPLDWYKEHVLRGARAAGLRADYIAFIEAVAADVDADAGRRERELAIYG